MRGQLGGDVLTFETTGDGPVQQRMVWRAIGADAVTWRNEISLDGGPCSLIEEYEYTLPDERAR